MSNSFGNSGVGIILGPGTFTWNAGNFAAEHPSSVAVEQVFKKEIARLTNNQLQVDVFPAMQLGGAKENVDAVRSGTLATHQIIGMGEAFRLAREEMASENARISRARKPPRRTPKHSRTTNGNAPR